MSESGPYRRSGATVGPIRIALVSVRCVVRGLPLFFRRTPRTPLRVVGVIALDALHLLRHARPLPREQTKELAMFLDLEGCANAVCDGKAVGASEYESVRRRLENAGWGARVQEYLGRLQELESRRPAIGGDVRRFDDVRSYREAVARLAIAPAAAVALEADSLEVAIRATWSDRDVHALFQILMQCQIIDDVMDYAADLSAGLPSFLTSSTSLRQSVALTAKAARSYASSRVTESGPAVYPLRIALSLITAATYLLIRAADLRSRFTPRFAP